MLTLWWFRLEIGRHHPLSPAGFPASLRASSSPLCYRACWRTNIRTKESYSRRRCEYRTCGQIDMRWNECMWKIDSARKKRTLVCLLVRKNPALARHPFTRSACVALIVLNADQNFFLSVSLELANQQLTKGNLELPLIVLSRSLPILIPSATVKGHFLRSSGVFLCKEIASNENFHEPKSHEIILNHLCLEKIKTHTRLLWIHHQMVSRGFPWCWCLFKILPDQPRIHKKNILKKKSVANSRIEIESRSDVFL